MKYMGSKRWMLKNGLGELLAEESKKYDRFFDFFSGSSAVSVFVAKKNPIPCYAYDLQEFSVVLSAAVLGRNTALDGKALWSEWSLRARNQKTEFFPKVPDSAKHVTQATVKNAREWSSKQVDATVTRAYGGHYFSPNQAIWIDCLRATLPCDVSEKNVCLAALIQASSQCAASPGHTAQPFQPTRTAKKFIVEAWNQDLLSKVKNALEAICREYALVPGSATVKNANDAALELRESDLVFLDPPYSGVHYSRFYHVLETISKGVCSEVSGIGRYPDQAERPISKYSMRGESVEALDELLKRISEKKAHAILTFPDHECSNGLSGKCVREIAKKYFSVSEKIVQSKFSTLGGTNRKSKTNNVRGARKPASELILSLSPISPMR